jgi:flagellar hook-associated protein 1 FlgK
MPWSFMGISTALSGILAQQRAMDTIGHNITNVNTPGYRRQEPVLVTQPPYPTARDREAVVIGGQVGTGVTVETIRRVRDDYLDLQLHDLSGQLGRWDAAEGMLVEVEATVAPSQGTDLGTLLDNFWAGWHDLSTNPEDEAARISLRQQGSALAVGIRETYERLSSLRREMNAALEDRVTEINNIAQEIAYLNREIGYARSKSLAPNDLLDRRDALVQRLTTIAGATASTPDENGAVAVSIGGRALVQGQSWFALDTAPGAGGTVNVQWAADGGEVRLQGGEMLGMLDVRDRLIPGYLDQLDALASALANEVNSRHAAGYGLDGSTGLDFFVPGSTGASIDVNPAILDDARRIAAAGVADSPGDGSVALDIAGLADRQVLAGRTLNGAYRALMTEVAADTKNVQDLHSARQLAWQQVSDQQQSVYGVNLDEELANMVTTQNAYAAAARVLTALDEMLDVLITRTAAS